MIVGEFLDKYDVYEMVIRKNPLHRLILGLTIESNVITDPHMRRACPGCYEVLTVVHVKSNSDGTAASSSRATTGTSSSSSSMSHRASNHHGVLLGDIICMKAKGHNKRQRRDDTSTSSLSPAALSQQWTFMTKADFQRRSIQSLLEDKFTFHVARLKPERDERQPQKKKPQIKISLDDIIVISDGVEPSQQHRLQAKRGDETNGQCTAASKAKADTDTAFSTKLPSKRVSLDQDSCQNDLSRQLMQQVMQRTLAKFHALRTECIDLAKQKDHLEKEFANNISAIDGLYVSMVGSPSPVSSTLGKRKQEEEHEPKGDEAEAIPSELKVPHFDPYDESYNSKQGEYIDHVETETAQLRLVKVRLQAAVAQQQASLTQLERDYETWAADYERCVDELGAIGNTEF